jgi:hypothetical protein
MIQITFLIKSFQINNNSFYLDKDPIKCTKYYCNKYVLKIPVKIALVMSKIHHELETGINYCKVYKRNYFIINNLLSYLLNNEYKRYFINYYNYLFSYFTF